MKPEVCGLPASCEARPFFPSLVSSLLLFLFLILSNSLLPRAQAQALFGSIVGTVTDPTGAVIPKATVTVTDISKGISQTTITNGAGGFEVSRLIPDTYSVTGKAPGFKQAESPTVTVFANQTQEVNLQLQTGAATQTVTVTGAAPPLETSHAEVANPGCATGQHGAEYRPQCQPV
jgi:hypothetical protein